MPTHTQSDTGSSTSLPSRERGLKYKSVRGGGVWLVSLPSRERGLKSVGDYIDRDVLGSLPSRERGLKYPYPGGCMWGTGRSLHGSVD